jgi:hypothetical protein
VHRYNSGQDAYGPGPNTRAEGSYSVQYIAWDASGATVSAIRTVTVDDRTAPTLRLRGEARMRHTCGSGWVDPGVEALDACYGAPTAPGSEGLSGPRWRGQRVQGRGRGSVGGPPPSPQ